MSFVTTLAVLCRSTVAIAFLLSAGWKLSHPIEFETVMAGAPLSLQRIVGSFPLKGPLVAAAEILIAIAILVDQLRWIAAFTAIGFLVLFSIFLARADTLANGCGCWRAPQRRKNSAKPYIIRNYLLAAIALISVASGQAATPTAHLALGAAAFLPALLLMEVPTIISLA